MPDIRQPPPADPAIHPRRFALALLLAGAAGAVDAVGFLHVRTFYVSFMSGNTTRVAVALADGDAALFAHGAAIIACFVAGVIAGDLIAGVPPRRRRAVLLIETALLLLAAAFHATFASILFLALAMGLHNALALHAERIGLALTYVTGTLVHLGRGIAARLGGRRDAIVWPYAALWFALAAGAVIGAATAVRIGEAPALTTLAAVLAAIALVTRSQPQEANS